jgi:hypothetical protein
MHIYTYFYSQPVYFSRENMVNHHIPPADLFTLSLLFVLLFFPFLCFETFNKFMLHKQILFLLCYLDVRSFARRTLFLCFSPYFFHQTNVSVENKYMQFFIYIKWKYTMIILADNTRNCLWKFMLQCMILATKNPFDVTWQRVGWQSVTMRRKIPPSLILEEVNNIKIYTHKSMSRVIRYASFWHIKIINKSIKSHTPTKHSILLFSTYFESSLSTRRAKCLGCETFALQSHSWKTQREF